MRLTIRVINETEKHMALNLIAADHLRSEGILEKGTTYWGAFVNEELVGLIGCEYENECGLLRSALVAKKFRGQGIGQQLTRVVLNTAEQGELEAIYLFSTGAGLFWTTLGFEKTSVHEVIEKLKNTPQVRLFERLGWLPTEVAYKFSLTEKGS